MKRIFANCRFHASMKQKLPSALFASKVQIRSSTQHSFRLDFSVFNGVAENDCNISLKTVSHNYLGQNSNFFKCSNNCILL